MNAPASLRPESASASDGARLSRAFVHAGIAEFARLSLGTPAAVFEALAASQGDDLATLLGTPPHDWRTTCVGLAHRPRPSYTVPSGGCLPT